MTGRLDGAGLPLLEPFITEIVDTTPPILVGVPEDIVVSTLVGESSATVSYGPVTATDETDPAAPEVTCSPIASGGALPVGTTTVTCSATDTAGNLAQASFTVRVIATRNSPAAAEDNGFVAGGGESETPMIRGGEVPGGPVGTSFFSVNHAYLNNRGEILVEANLTGGSATENLGLWSSGGGNPLGLVALEGDDAAGTDFAGTTIKSFGQISLNNAGVVGAAAFVQGGGATAASDQGLFSEFGSGGFTGRRREGSIAPDSGTGIFSGLSEPALAEALIAVPGTLKLDAAAGINASNDRGIWTNSGALVREGALVIVPGVAPAAIYGQFEPRVVATADDTVAFAGIVAGNGTANRLLLTGSPGNLRVVAARNQVIDGVTIDRFDAESLNDAGDVAFRSTLAGVPANANSAVFTGVGSTLSMVVRENDAATGQEPGVLFDRFEELHLIDGGDLVFRAYLRGTDVDSSSDAAIYHYSAATDTLRPVVREGDPAVSTDSALILNLREFDVNAGGGIVYTATLVPSVGDTTSANNLGLWLSPPGGDSPELAARKGDEFTYAPGDLRTILTLTIDGVANAAGGVGSTPKVLSDSGQAIIKVTNNLGGGAFLVGGINP